MTVGRAGGLRTWRLPGFLPAALAATLALLLVGTGLWAHALRARDRTLASRVAALSGQQAALAAERTEVAEAKAALAAQSEEASSLRSTVAALQGQATHVRELRVKVAALLGKAAPPPAAPRQVAAKMRTAHDVLAQVEQTLPAFDRSLQALGGELNGWRQNALQTPSIWPVRGPITSPFGPRPNPFGPGVEFHHGVDIGVPTGTAVHVTASGVVITAGWNNVYGNMVRVDHGNGIVTLYGHNSKLLVHAGEHVVKGQVIADSGSTGMSTGPHVHYGVYVDGTAVNPERYLPGGGSDLQANAGTRRGGYGGG